MGKAHHSPGKRDRHFIVTHHAEERFRQRLNEENLKHRTTENVKDLLDEAIDGQIKHDKFQRWWQKGDDGEPEEIYVVEVGDYVGSEHKMWALVVPRGRGGPVVRTVLDDEMVRNNSATKWARSAEGLSRPGLKTGLDIPAEVKKAVAEAAKPEAKPVSKKDISPFCVVFSAPGATEREIHFTFGAEETKKAVRAIYEKYPNAKVSVWEPSDTVTFKARVVVEFE